MNYPKVQISERLAEERLRLGKTQKEMAALGKVGDRSYWHYEKGERSPDAEFLENLAQAGADVLYILTGQRAAGLLQPDEAALLDNYRHSSPDNQAVLRKVGAALEKQSGDEKKCG